MKNLITKAVALILTILITFALVPFSASGYDIYNYSLYSNLDNVMLLKNENQVYLAGIDNKTVYIDSLYNSKTCTTLSLENKPSSINLCNNMFIFSCHINSTKQTQVVLYDIKNDILTSFILNSDIYYLNSQTAYSDNFVYLARSNGVVNIYSSKGKFINQLDLNTDLSSLICDFDGNVFALTEDGAYLISNDYCKRVSNFKFTGAGSFIDKNFFTANFGSIYKTNTLSVDKVIEHDNNAILSSGGVYKNYAIVFNENTVFAIDINSGAKKRNIKLSNNISQLFTIDDTIIALCYDSYTPTVVSIDFSELKAIKQTGFADSNNTDSEFADFSISSNVYTVDFQNNKILGIESGTTVSKFKNNMNYDGYELKLYRYNKDDVLTSGNVGTATLAVFYNENSIYEFELCVAGDLTGEGNINSRDKDAMFDFLLDNIAFSGVFLDASDLNNSEDIKVDDLVLLLRLIENQK